MARACHCPALRQTVQLPDVQPGRFQQAQQQRGAHRKAPAKFGSVAISSAPQLVKWPSSATARPSMVHCGSPWAMVQPLWPWRGQEQVSPTRATAMPMIETFAAALVTAPP